MNHELGLVLGFQERMSLRAAHAGDVCQHVQPGLPHGQRGAIQRSRLQVIALFTNILIERKEHANVDDQDI